MSSTNQLPPDEGNEPHRKLASVKLSPIMVIKEPSAPNILIPCVESIVVTVIGSIYKKIYNAFPISEDKVKIDWDQNWKSFSKWEQH